jgi:hypothetical protein
VPGIFAVHPAEALVPSLPANDTSSNGKLRRTLRRTVARCGLGTALAVSAFTMSCGTACATGYIQVVPVGVTSYVYPVDLSQLPGSLQPDVMGRTYSNISVDGGAPQTVTVTGYSVQALLGKLDPAATFSFAEVLGPLGRSVLLTKAQITSATAFPDGPPVVWDGSGGAHFLLPSTGPGPAQEGESFTGFTDQGGTVTINLHSGALLTVAISGPKGPGVVGKPVHFSSSVSGVPRGTTLSYGWYFDDGNGGSGLSVSHTYIVAGTYDVYLRVTGSNDSLGFSPVVPITVGKAPKGPNRVGGGARTEKHAATHGAGAEGLGGAKDSHRVTTTRGATESTAPTSHRGTATRVKAAAKSSKTRRAVLPRLRRFVGPLLSGIAVGSTDGLATRSRPPHIAAPGVTNSARTGHLRSSAGDLAEGLWITLGIVAAVVGGALLEWTGPQWIRRRMRLTAAIAARLR